MSAKTIRLTVADSDGRRDLFVPADSTVAELLTGGGIDLRRYLGTTTAGAAIDLASEVSDTPGDGGILWLIDREQAVAQASSASLMTVDAPVATRMNAVLLALLSVIIVFLVACAIVAPVPMIVTVASLLLLLSAVVLVAQPVRSATTYVAFFAPLLGSAAGAVSLSPFRDPGAMMAAGAIGGATFACTRHAQARVWGSLPTATTSVLAVVWSVIAVIHAAAFIADVPAAAIAAVQLACALPLVRYMRAAALDVDPSELIDIPFLIRDAQGLRYETAIEPSLVYAEQANTQYLVGRRRSEAGIVAACILAVFSALYVVAAADSGSPETWCVLGGAVGAGCYLLLATRMLRDVLGSAAVLVAGAVITVVAASALIFALQLSAFLIAFVLMATGTIVGLLTVPLSGGWRSLGWSRTGDILEGFLLVLAPAALLYGSGIAGQLLEVFS